MEIGQVVVALLLVCTEIIQTAADVVATSPHNDTSRFQSVTAAFGLQPNGQMGLLVVANPPDACQIIHNPPLPPNVTDMYMYFALIKRGNCEFDMKVFNAQQAGYLGAIVYNDEGNILTTMSGSKYAKSVYIPSVFVGLDSGLTLRGMNYTTGYSVVLLPTENPSLGYYFLPFVSVTSTCLLFFALYAVSDQALPALFPMDILLLISHCRHSLLRFFLRYLLGEYIVVTVFCVSFCAIFSIAKYVRDQRRRRKARLSRDHLKKLPTKKFKKGDEYDVCAICLDDYEEGQKLRILPCNHAYHCKCIDPWLTNNRRTCPICKRKVIPPGMADSDEESDSEAGDSPTENTPLLSSMQSDNLSDRGAVGGHAETATPPPSPMTSIEDDDEYAPIETLIKVDSDSESSGSFPLEEATNIQVPPNVLSVSVHSENETEPSTSSTPTI